MKKVKLLPLIVSVVLLFSLCACDENNESKTFSDIIGLTSDKAIRVIVRDEQNDMLETFEDKAVVNKIFELMSAHEYYEAKKTEGVHEVDFSLSFHDEDEKLYSFMISDMYADYFIVFDENAEEVDGGKTATLIYRINDQNGDLSELYNYLKSLRLTKRMGSYAELDAFAGTKVSSIEIKDTVLKKQLNITEPKAVADIINAFDVDFYSKGSVECKAEDFRYQLVIYYADAEGFTQTLLFDKMTGDSVGFYNYWFVDVEGIDWDVLKNLDWSKAEDIKE